MTNTTKKLTKRDYYNALLKLEEVKANENLIKFIEHELELLEKKNSSDKKPTATQKENAILKDLILNFMEENRYYTVTEILKGVDELKTLSTPKVSALVRQLKLDGLVIRKEEKGKAYFILAE